MVTVEGGIVAVMVVFDPGIELVMTTVVGSVTVEG